MVLLQKSVFYRFLAEKQHFFPQKSEYLKNRILVPTKPNTLLKIDILRAIFQLSLRGTNIWFFKNCHFHLALPDKIGQWPCSFSTKNPKKRVSDVF